MADDDRAEVGRLVTRIRRDHERGRTESGEEPGLSHPGADGADEYDQQRRGDGDPEGVEDRSNRATAEDGGELRERRRTGRRPHGGGGGVGRHCRGGGWGDVPRTRASSPY